MAAKGTKAKEEVMNRIAAAFGSDTVGICDKKLYVQVMEDGVPVQIAIALTCPKVPMGKIEQSATLNFEDTTIAGAAPTKFEAAEFTEDERRTVEDLIKALGL